MAAVLSGCSRQLPIILFGLRGDEMSEYNDRYTDLQTCLEDILRDKGIAVFRDSNQIVGMVRDLMPEKASNWKVMQRMADCGILKSFADADNRAQEERERAVRTAIFKLVDQESIDASKAQNYVWTIAGALGWAIRKGKTSQEMSPQKVSIPQSAPTVKAPESAPVVKRKLVLDSRNTAQTTAASDSDHQRLKGSVPKSKQPITQSNNNNPVSQKGKGFWLKIGSFINLLSKLWFLLYAVFAFSGAVIAPFTNPDFSVTHVQVAALAAAALCLGHFGKKVSFKPVQAISKLIRRIGAFLSSVVITGAIPVVALNYYMGYTEGELGWPGFILGILMFFAALSSIAVLVVDDI